MREIELSDCIWTEDDEDGDGELLFYVSESEGVKWPYETAEFADWKDDQAKFDGVAALAKKGAEVVILEDNSDTYIFVSMADAIPLR